MLATRREFMAAGGALLAMGGVGRASTGAAGSMLTVLTCPRPRGASYIIGTLGQIDREGIAAPKVIVCDGYEVRRDGWTTAVVPERARQAGRVDNKIPGWVAIWTALSAGRDLLFLEDDVRGLHPDSFRRMLDYQVPEGVAFTSFYHRLRKPGVYPAAVFDMSQTVKIPYRTLAILWDFKVNGPRGDWESVTGVDLAIAVACKLHGNWNYELAPNAVEHVGEISAVAPGQTR